MYYGKHAYRKGTCPICEKSYAKGDLCWFDKRKSPGNKYVHYKCYEGLMLERRPLDPPTF